MIAFRILTADDAATIAALARQTFVDTFGHLYAPDDLAAFLAGHSEAAWRDQIADPAFHVRLVEADGEIAGYLKLGPPSLPFTPAANAIELRQFYLLGAYHGRRGADGTTVSDRMMAEVMAITRGAGFADLYLSVFTDNHRARRFYARHGFAEVGPYTFKVGNHEDEDIVLRRTL